MSMFFLSRNRSAENGQETGSRRRMGCLKGCLVFIAIYIVSSVLIGWLFGSLFSPKPVELKDQTVYRLQMKGNLVEQAKEDNPFLEIFGSVSPYGNVDENVGLDRILDNIRLAKNDDRILGIWLDGAELSMTPAAAKAIRDALLDFKTSGKWVVASAVHYEQTNYYVATAADCICLDPMIGTVDWNGLAAEQMYFTRLLEKIGVEMQILKVGTFKSAVEPFFRTSMSEEDRKQTREMLDAIWNEYRSAVGAARHLSAENLDVLADRYMGILPAEEQLAARLVDTLLYAQDMDSLLRVFCGTKDYHLMTTNRLAQVKRIDSKAADKVAVIYLEGEITDDSGEGIVAKEVIKTLKKINKDDDVKALVVRVNSPGGSAEASEQIWHALENIKAAGKPVVVSMGGMAASGGYYISCGADYIYAEPTTFTGSIGIFGMIPNVAKLRDKVGIDVDGVSTHKHSAASTNMVYKGFTADERAMMQTMIERGYDLFTKRCADGRNKTQDYIKSIGEGRVWIGTKAKELGLVDEFGNIDNAIAKAVELAGLESYKLAYYPEVLDFMEEILKNMDNTTEEERLVMKIRNFASKPRIMALMPELEIQ